jgi:hypothetical protein
MMSSARSDNELMPTFGAALASERPRVAAGATRLSPLAISAAWRARGGRPARLSRTWATTPTRARPGQVGRQRGAPRRLVSRADQLGSGAAGLVPYAAARYSLLHGLSTRRTRGVRVARNAHSLETEFFYSVPTFDGDSIFNVFSTEPYSDLRSSYHYRPRESHWSGYLRGWGRRYHSEDRGRGRDEPALWLRASTPRGCIPGVSYRLARDQLLRLDAILEDGYGGLRVGSYLAASAGASGRARC